MNRTKTEQAVFEDTIGCTNENAYADMVATKKRFHKMGGVEGYHLVQSFAEGEVTPELAHLIGQELADRLLKGQYEVVITTHLNTRHYHNHIVWNSVSMADGRKYHSNAKSYYTEIRKISDDLCRKYGLSIIESNQKKSIPYVQWKAEQEGKPTWRMLWSSIFVTLMANKIGGLQFGIYRNCQISSRVFHTAVAALPLTKANRSDFE